MGYADYVKQKKEGKLTSNKSGGYARYSAEKRLNLDTFDADLAAASDLVNKVYSGWQSADDMKSSYKTVSAMRDRLNAHKSYTNDYSNGQDLTKYNDSMDKLIAAYDTALTDWDALSAEYAKYADADSYGVAKKNAERYNKYKGLDFDSVRKAMEENPDDAEFLSKYGLNVGYSDKADVERELNTVDYLIETTSGEEKKAWKEYRNRLYEATMVNPNALFKGSEAFADGYQPGDLLDALGATAADAFLRGTKGFLGSMEGLADLGAYGVSKVAGFFGLDGVEDSLKNFAQKNMTQDLYRPLYSTSINEDSFLGGLGHSVGEGVGQIGFNLMTGKMGAGFGKNGAGIASKAGMFASSAGSGMSEAYNSGATDMEALAYGLMSATAETGSEMMFGGLGKSVNALGLSRGIASLDDQFARKVGSKINNLVLRNAAEMGIKATGEGLEEMVSGLGSAVAKKFTYMSDEDLMKLIDDEDLLNQFLVGTLSSAVTQTPSLMRSYKYGTDFVTDRTAAEEFYVTSEYEARLAEAEKDGKELSNKEKDKLYRQVEKDLTTAQEEAYNAAKRNAPNAVGRMAHVDVTDTIDNETGSKIKVQGIRTDESGNTVLKTNMGERNLDSVTLNRRDAELVAMAEEMEESRADLFVSMYNGQDATQYKDSFDLAYAYGKNAFGVENAIKRHGVLTESQALQVYKLGVSERTAAPQKKADAITEKYFSDGGTVKAGTFSDKGVNYNKLNSRQKAAASFAKMFSKATGVNVVLFESKADEKGVRTAENGRYEKSTNTVYIDVYAGFKENEGIFEDSMIPTMSHELTHWMKEKAPEAYAKLSEIVMDTLSREHNARPEVLVAYEKQNHKKRGRNVSDEYAQDELIARACEDMLSGNKTANEIIEQMDEETAKTFSEKFKEVVAKIRAWLKELLGVYKSGSEEAKILRRYDDKLAELQKAWDEGLEKAIRANQAMQNSEAEDVAASDRTQRSDRVTYSYEYLTSKPDMKVTYVENVGAIDRKDVVKKALSNVKEVGYVNENGNAMVRVEDIEKDIMVPKHSITHGMDRRFVNQAPVLIHIGEVLKNSIRINELNPRSENISDSYILLGAARGDNSFYTVSFVVNSYTGEVDKIEVLYSANVKTEPAALLPTVTEKNSATPTDSTISIADLLGFVNKHFPDLLSEDVLKHFGHDRRPDGRIGNDVLFSDRDSEGNGLTPEQVEFFKDSKVRDEDGNLKVMYHGTSNASFTVFNPQYSDDGTSLFFTDSKTVAKGYSGTMDEYIPGKKYTVKELTDIINDSFLFVTEEDGKYHIIRNKYGDLVKEHTTDTLEEMQNYVLEEYGSIGAGNYKVYLNIENPLIVDANGRYWDELEGIGDAEGTTRGYAKYAKENGYDGVIIKDVVDTAIYAAGNERFEVSTVAIVFSPEQIKSVANENPTTDPDIRYSERSTESIYDAVGELKRIQRENDKLKADIERLRKKNRLERTVTGGRELNESHIAAVAGHVLKMADSRYNKADFTSELKAIYAYLQGEDVTWDEFMSKATDVAQRIVAEAREHKVKDDYAMMILSTIRNARVSFNDTQKAEAEYAYGKNWNRNYFGRVTVANDGIPLESVWSEWASMYPDVFDADISDADMVTALLDIYDSTRTASEVVETYDKSEAARAIAFEIYNQFWNVSPVRTLADKHDKEVKRLKFEHRQEMKELRERKDAEVFETKWHYSKLIHEVREARDEKIAQLKKESHEYTKQYREKVERRNQISQITKKSLKLNTWLKKNSKDEHIVEELKAPVAAVLKALDFSSERFLGTGVPTQKDISLKKAFAHLYESLSEIETDNLKKAKEDNAEYNIDMPADYVEFVKGIKDQVEGIVDKVGDNEYVLRDMTVEQLQDVNKMLTVLTHIVTSANKALADANGKAISTMAQSTMLYADSLGNKKKKVGAISDFFNFDNGLPVYVFKMMGEGGQQIFRNMQNGWDKMAFHVKQIIDYSEKCYDAKEVKKWSKEVHELKFSDGSEVKMTTAQIMSLYCLQKREQARQHLVQGGMRIADFKIGLNKYTNENGVLLLPHEIDKVISKLTKRQKEVADSLQEFMITVCADWGNEVSLRRFGIKSFGEENYFPIQSDASLVTGDDTPKDDNGSNIFRLLNMGFTKGLNLKANNRIVVDNIFDVFATHTSDMAKYNAMALPVLDMFRWYSYKESYRIKPDDPNDLRKKTNSLRQSLKKAYGDGSTRYLYQFMKDINGAHSGGMSNVEKIGRKMMSNYKVAAVGANLRVAILQPTSYMRAAAVIDPKYLAAALAHKPQIQKAKDTCGIALWKSLGFYDTNISRGVRSLIKHDEGGFQKAKEISLKLAEWGDAMTWGYLYNACEAEIKATQPGLSGAAKDKAVADRLRDVIYATQVVDSTMTRTQTMRNTSTMNQMMTSFMSEPSLSYNMLHDLYIQYNADKRRYGKGAAFKKNGRRILRVSASYLTTLFCASLAGGWIDTLRDDDDDEEFVDKLIANVTENALSDAVSMLPWIRDVVSIYKGYNVNRMDMQGVQSTYYAVRKLYKAIMEGDADYKTVYSVATSISKAFSQTSGLPVSNFWREFTTIWNNTIGEMYESLKLK